MKDLLKYQKMLCFVKMPSVLTIIRPKLNCQVLSISKSLNLSLSLRDRDRADTIITFHTTPPPETF